MRGKPNSLEGKKFNRLLVVGKGSLDSRGNRLWKVRCDCGSTREVQAGNLLNGGTKSCGCYAREALSKRVKTHGKSKTPEFKAWQSMWQRCTNPKASKHELYRDKSPPEEWRDFNVFFLAVGPRPGPRFSLDRIDGSKPYGPGNVRWADFKTQNINRSSVQLWLDSQDGQKVCTSEMAKRLGRSSTAIRYWLRVKGQTIEEATSGRFSKAKDES